MSKQAETIKLLNSRLVLDVDPEGFKPGLDSVMLAAACLAKDDERVLELGVGVGGAALCLLARLPEIQMTGVDIQQESLDIGTKNAGINSHSKRIEFILGDVGDYRVENSERFNHVIMNPPYLEGGAHLQSPSKRVAKARGYDGPDIGLQAWVDSAFDNLLAGGSLTIIHRADTVDKIIKAMGKRFGRIEIIPLWPKAGRDAKRVIVRALKDRKSSALMRAGLTLHQDDGSYTPETEQILREAKALCPITKTNS